jgi:hypothetical protein
MTKGTHPKGICDLRKFLQKAQVRLTQAGSLIIGYLCKAGSLVRGINDLTDSYLPNPPKTGSDCDFFVRV